MGSRQRFRNVSGGWWHWVPLGPSWVGWLVCPETFVGGHTGHHGRWRGSGINAHVFPVRSESAGGYYEWGVKGEFTDVPGRLDQTEITEPRFGALSPPSGEPSRCYLHPAGRPTCPAPGKPFKDASSRPKQFICARGFRAICRRKSAGSFWKGSPSLGSGGCPP